MFVWTNQPLENASEFSEIRDKLFRRKGRALCEPFIRFKDVRDQNVIARFQREIVLQENIESRPLEAALTHVFAPPFDLEGLPMLVVKHLHVEPLRLRLSEKVVLYQIGRKQWCPLRIQSLED